MTRAELLVDSSVAIAALVHDHENHLSARHALRDQVVGLSGHAWFESLSVLTRLPPPRRVTSHRASELLVHNFPGTRWLDQSAQQELAVVLAERDIAGGAVYDALVGWVAVTNRLPLLTRDNRARNTYQRLEVETIVID